MPRNRKVGAEPSLGERGAVVLGLIAFAFALQFTTPNLGSLDGYFHVRYAAYLREAGWRGFPPPFPWLPLTLLAPDRYFDHHMLFHVWLAPFARGGLVLGAKLAAACGAAAAFLSVQLLFLGRGVRRAAVWTAVLLAAAPGFLYRMEMPRAQAWAVVFLVAGLALLAARRYAWLLPLGWMFAWTYNAFPALPALAACHGLARRVTDGDIAWRPLLFAAAGVALGLIVNPYFPDDVRFIAHHFAGKIAEPTVRAGLEWDPFPVARWFGTGGLIALLVALVVALRRYRAALDADRLTAALAAAGFLVLTWRWSRFLEYLVPFSVIALALCFHERLDAFLRRRSRPWRRRAAVALALWLTATATVAALQLRGRPPSDRYRRAAQWIARHSPTGALVLNANWDDFPLLYFHDPRNTYVIGLDPTYLSRRDAALYADWLRLRDGDVEEPSRLLADRFGAAVAVTDRRPQGFIAAMDRDPAVERAYEDDEAIVYRVRDAPAAPGGAS